MKIFLDLFCGIGGFALAAYNAGLRFDKHYFSEIDRYAIEIYKKRFPEAELLGDIKNVNYADLPKGKYLVTGGFPCQPHSSAGLKGGANDKRDLWPECRRMLCDLRPDVALFENVRGLLISPGGENKGKFFNGVLSDIHKCGYNAEWQIIPASEVGAPHERKRIWIVSYPHGAMLQGGNAETKTGVVKKQLPRLLPPDFRLEVSELQIYRDDNGISHRVDRLKCTGNAIVPHCAQLVFLLPVFDGFRKVPPPIT